jgi:hypothetical protein
MGDGHQRLKDHLSVIMFVSPLPSGRRLANAQHYETMSIL